MPRALHPPLLTSGHTLICVPIFVVGVVFFLEVHNTFMSRGLRGRRVSGDSHGLWVVGMALTIFGLATNALNNGGPTSSSYFASSEVQLPLNARHVAWKLQTCRGDTLS